jgi:hypothetical protein
MNKSPLMAVIDAAAKRFDQRPIYQASDATRAELQMLEQAAQGRPAQVTPANVDKK